MNENENDLAAYLKAAGQNGVTETIALTTQELIMIHTIAQAAANAEDRVGFDGGSIQYLNDRAIEEIDVAGKHIVLFSVQLAPDHYRLFVLAKMWISDHPVQVMVDADADMVAELQKPKYNISRFA